MPTGTGNWTYPHSPSPRGYWSQCRALMLKAVAHNILVLLCALRAVEATPAAA